MPMEESSSYQKENQPEVAAVELRQSATLAFSQATAVLAALVQTATLLGFRLLVLVFLAT